MKKLCYLFSLLGLLSLADAQQAIQVEKKGEGNPVLFLPGFTTPGSVWDETISNLNGDFQTYQVSYAGFNGLEPIGTPWYNPVKKALIAYIEKEGLTNLTVIGHSMGGNLAVELAAALGSKVKKLILIDSLPCMRAVMMPGVSADALAYDSPYNNQMLQMPNEAFKNVALSMAQNMTNQPDKMPLLAQWTLDSDRETYVYGYTDLLKLDLRTTLAEIIIPTLIIGAPFPSEEVAQQTLTQQYENLPNKEISMVSGSKHFIMFDQPEWLYEKINTYLAGNAQ